MAVEWFLLDDPDNALTLSAVFGKKDRLEVTRITFPLADPVGVLEASLAHEHRAVLYGIYFDFQQCDHQAAFRRDVTDHCLGHEKES